MKVERAICPLIMCLAFAVVGLDARVLPGQRPTTRESECVLSLSHDGQMISVTGRVRSEPHDMGFGILGCPDTILLTFAGGPDNDVSANSLVRNKELRLFQEYTSAVYEGAEGYPKYVNVEAKLTGKLEVAKVPSGATRDQSGLLWDQSGKVVGTSGWGHPSPYARYRLIIFAVNRVKAQKSHPPKALAYRRRESD